MRTAIIYDFFPHYRAAVLRELLRSPEHNYLLVADTRAVEPSIKTWPVEDPTRFRLARCRLLGRGLLLQKGLLGLGLSRRFDAIVYLGNPYFLSTWASAALARTTGKRVLFWTHGWTREESGPKAQLRRCFYRLAHGLLLYGHQAKMVGIAAGFAPERLYVIYNSLDYEAQKRAREAVQPDELPKLRQELFGDSQTAMVICSARLTPQCRFDLLLQAQAQLAAEGHRIHVLLVGDGPERPKLEAQAQRLKLPVRFLGACYEEQVLARLTMAAHVTVSPGKVGLTALQSLAYGTPVITHDDWQAQGPEWEAILPGRTGDFFRRNDPSDLARVMVRWTRPPQVPEAVRRDCYALVERFYNPAFQRRAIDRAVSGAPADDLFWLREQGRTTACHAVPRCSAVAAGATQRVSSFAWRADPVGQGPRAPKLDSALGLPCG